MLALMRLRGNDAWDDWKDEKGRARHPHKNPPGRSVVNREVK